MFNGQGATYRSTVCELQCKNTEWSLTPGQLLVSMSPSFLFLRNIRLVFLSVHNNTSFIILLLLEAFFPAAIF